MQTENPKDPKPIQELMNGTTLGAIIKKAQILDKIEHCLSDWFNKEVRDAVHVVNLKEHCLILASNNSAIATRLRYQEEDLLIKLSRITDLPEITRIECIVRP